ncbi:hypothetical protein CVO96_20045 [Deinococcus koreensis]|uniref:Uncharacterized protein n=1 Tax=Deinococcus koreensis TaxID=2054903 RepID=A0A2K3URT4_9DEIO|nr:hypothetical protein CVO96_20045 [Deinococcus koreensis]
MAFGGALSSEAATTGSRVYYQTVSIDQVLRTRPATVIVSPLYQVTVQVMGAEVTGISLELSKQRHFSVSRAENGRMIFLDVLAQVGGADLNLILDDETVLPIRLQVANSPSGTRVYKFMTADAVAAQSAAQAFGEQDASTAPRPAAPAAADPAPLPTSTSPAQAAAAAKVGAATPQPRMTGRAARPPAAGAPPAPQAVAAPVTRPAQVQATRATPTPAPRAVTPPAATPAAARPAAARPIPVAEAATLDVTAQRDGRDALVAYKLTSPTGGPLFSNPKTVQITAGRTLLPTVPVARPSSMAPILGLLRVKNAPKEITLSLTVQTLGPARSFTLSRQVPVR